MLTVYIGWDPAETEAYKVAEHSCIAKSSQPVRVIPLKAHELYQWRLLWRPVEFSGPLMRDHLSSAPQATQFASSRFLVPSLHKSGWALFIDCDMLFLDDVAELFSYADPRYAVMCVKHNHQPKETKKMGGHEQTAYQRKNWSSVMLWNCDHPSNNRLTVEMINSWPGLLLHRFAWLKDEEIGELPAEWNWLVNVSPKPKQPKLAHYTLGGPWIAKWKKQPCDNLWLEAHEQTKAR